MKYLITGVTGFIGMNYAIRLLKAGAEVIGVDNFSTSNREKLDKLEAFDHFSFIEASIENLDGCINGLDLILNFACPASPPRYQANPLSTISANIDGIRKLLELAHANKCILLHSSTSEVYGQPEVSPQSEDYFGNVNTWGPRACYDEGKRMAETICYEYLAAGLVDVRVVRIFNTYGPHMDANDGRVISNLLNQAIRDEPLTIYGGGTQTRSFCYIDDLLDAMDHVLNLDKLTSPINIGNSEEITINHLVDEIEKISGRTYVKNYQPLPEDDPLQRKPDLSMINQLCSWDPEISLSEGLARTFEYFRSLNK